MEILYSFIFQICNLIMSAVNIAEATIIQSQQFEIHVYLLIRRQNIIYNPLRSLKSKVRLLFDGKLWLHDAYGYY